MLHNSDKFYIPALILALALAAFLRFWAAPLSAGQDDAQFWAFAKVFQAHGLDFYRYAEAKLDIFPYPGWGFFYPPIWLLLLGMALLFVPTSLVANHMIDPSWRIAMKSPIIIADLAIGLLIYWAVPGSKLRKLLFACLWLFHPTAWYESAIFGQFDAIAAALLLASVILLLKGKDRVAFLAAGLAVMTKQHTLLPIALMLVISARHLARRRLLIDCSILAGVIILISIPFLVTGNVSSYFSSIFLGGSKPDYQGPLVFAFSGSGALLTYLHDVFGWETVGLLKFSIPLLFGALAIAAFLCYRKAISPLQGALAGFLLFVALFYRVNYQYLVTLIPLAILQASRTHFRSEKVFALFLAIFPAVWLWLADVPFWFNDHDPHYPWVNPILAHFGLLDRYLPDYAYVYFAVALMCLSLAYVILTFVRWRQPTDRSNLAGIG
jgi:hypothetical protein